MRRFVALRQTTITAQSLWRGRCVRRMLCMQKAAAILIQVPFNSLMTCIQTAEFCHNLQKAWCSVITFFCTAS